MALLSDELARSVQDWCAQHVSDDRLSDSGRERESHCTIKYGLIGSSADTLVQLRCLLATFGAFTMRLDKDLSLFENDDEHVLKVRVISRRAHDLNSLITHHFDCFDKHAQYKPHVTICYLKPKYSHLYDGVTTGFCGKEFLVDSLLYSGDDAHREFIRLAAPRARMVKAYRDDLHGVYGFPYRSINDPKTELGEHFARFRARPEDHVFEIINYEQSQRNRASTAEEVEKNKTRQLTPDPDDLAPEEGHKSCPLCGGNTKTDEKSVWCTQAPCDWTKAYQGGRWSPPPPGAADMDPPQFGTGTPENDPKSRAGEVFVELRNRPEPGRFLSDRERQIRNSATAPTNTRRPGELTPDPEDLLEEKAYRGGAWDPSTRRGMPDNDPKTRLGDASLRIRGGLPARDGGPHSETNRRIEQLMRREASTAEEVEKNKTRQLTLDSEDLNEDDSKDLSALNSGVGAELIGACHTRGRRVAESPFARRKALVYKQKAPATTLAPRRGAPTRVLVRPETHPVEEEPAQKTPPAQHPEQKRPEDVTVAPARHETHPAETTPPESRSADRDVAQRTHTANTHEGDHTKPGEVSLPADTATAVDTHTEPKQETTGDAPAQYAGAPVEVDKLERESRQGQEEPEPVAANPVTAPATQRTESQSQQDVTTARPQRAPATRVQPKPEMDIVTPALAGESAEEPKEEPKTVSERRGRQARQAVSTAVRAIRDIRQAPERTSPRHVKQIGDALLSLSLQEVRALRDELALDASGRESVVAWIKDQAGLKAKHEAEQLDMLERQFSGAFDERWGADDFKRQSEKVQQDAASSAYGIQDEDGYQVIPNHLAWTIGDILQTNYLENGQTSKEDVSAAVDHVINKLHSSERELMAPYRDKVVDQIYQDVSKHNVQAPDWRPDESLPEDYYVRKNPQDSNQAAQVVDDVAQVDRVSDDHVMRSVFDDDTEGQRQLREFTKALSYSEEESRELQNIAQSLVDLHRQAQQVDDREQRRQIWLQIDDHNGRRSDIESTRRAEQHRQLRRLIAPKDAGAVRFDTMPFLVADNRRVVDSIRAAQDYLSGLIHSSLTSDQHVKFARARAESNRAYFSTKDKQIHLTDQATVQEVLHEYGHFLTEDPRVKFVCLLFQQARVKDEAQQSLSELFPDLHFDSDDTGAKDQFDKLFAQVHQAYYCGQLYPDGQNEILSMGLELLYDDPARFARVDPEYFQLVTGLISGRLLENLAYEDAQNALESMLSRGGESNPQGPPSVSKGDVSTEHWRELSPQDRSQMRERRKSFLAETTPLHTLEMGAGITRPLTLEFPDGETAIFKPVQREAEIRYSVRPGNYHKNEVAASSIAEFMGLDEFVPATTSREHPDHGLGSVQEFVEDAYGAHEVGVNQRFGDSESLAKVAAFDYLLCNTDRNVGNWMFRPSDGSIHLIDHGLCMPYVYDPADMMESQLLGAAVLKRLDLPDFSHLRDKRQDFFDLLRSLQLPEGSIKLTLGRFDILTSGRFKSVADLPNLNIYGPPTLLEEMNSEYPIFSWGQLQEDLRPSDTRSTDRDHDIGGG